ncbi:MAG: hypothetical protein ACXVP0_15665 [Bacteroidia bacterium]
MRTPGIKLIFCFTLLWALTGCVSVRPNLRVSQVSYCAPVSPYVYESGYLPLPDIAPLVKSDSLLLKRYTYQDLSLANASGSFYLLRDLIHMQETINEGDEDNDSLVYMLIKKQQIFNRLLLASIEVASLAAELDCESERAKQLATNLDQINDTRIQRFTIISVVTGAATAIGTSAIKNNDAQISIGITGSIISAIFGGLAAISSRRTIEFLHRRNLLADIWNEPKTSAFYPPFVWYVLSSKELNNGVTSTFQSLKDRWVLEGLLDAGNAKQTNLLFGAGGKYAADDLHTRANMINQLKAEVRSINQNLQALMLKLSV